MVSVVSASGLEYALGFYRFVVKREEGIPARWTSPRNALTSWRNAEKPARFKKAIAEFKSPYVSQILEIVLAARWPTRASDIHLEPSSKKPIFACALTACCTQAAEIQTAAYGSLVTRIKLLSNLKINIHDEAQDGRFTIGAGKAEVKSAPPSSLPSSAKLSCCGFLTRPGIHVTLADLGLPGDDLKIIEEELNKPNRMILNTGPADREKRRLFTLFTDGLRGGEQNHHDRKIPLNIILRALSRRR